jgi:hypothetical protein
MQHLLNIDAVSLRSVTDKDANASPNLPTRKVRTFQAGRTDVVSIAFYDAVTQPLSTKLPVELPVTRRRVRPLTLPACVHSDSSAPDRWITSNGGKVKG